MSKTSSIDMYTEALEELIRQVMLKEKRYLSIQEVKDFLNPHILIDPLFNHFIYHSHGIITSKMKIKDLTTPS